MENRELLARATVRDYMHSPVRQVPASAPVTEVAALLRREEISGAPVVDAEGRAVGVVTLTDLMALRLFGPELALLRSAPDEDVRVANPRWTSHTVRAAELMTPEVWSASVDEPLLVAAARMVSVGVHRLVVTEPAPGDDVHGLPVGILSTLDCVRAARDADLAAPIVDYATRDVVTVEVGTPVSEVVRRLLEGHFTGVPVVDGGWPVGFLSPMDLLGVEGDLANLRVEDVASPAMICVDEYTPIGTVSAEVVAKGIRRILAVRHRHVTGILTSVDITRALCA